jgi:sugar lactone lactonase YvrE
MEDGMKRRLTAWLTVGAAFALLVASPAPANAADTTRPTVSIVAPTRNQVFPVAPITFSGTATDDVGVTAVQVAIHNLTTNQWWHANGTWGTYQLQSASLAAPGTPSTGWSYVWTPLGTGSYAVLAQAKDAAGNITTPKPTVPFSVSDAPPPPPPSVSLVPLRVIGGSGHAQLYPWNVATMPDGTLLVSDYWNFRIVRYATDGTFLGTVVDASNQGTGYGQHESPYGLVVDPVTNDIFFGDVDGGKSIDRYDYDPNTGTWHFGLQWGSAGTGTGKYMYPSYLAESSDRRLFIADQWAHQVVVTDLDGHELFRFGGNGSLPGQFKQDRGLAFCHHCDSPTSDLLYVADNYNARVQEFRVQDGGTTTSSVTFIRQFVTKGTNPGQIGANPDLRGVAVDETHGFVYLSDAASGWVNQYDLNGVYTGLRMGGYAAGPGQMIGGPRGISVDHDGNVWVGDMPGFRFVEFSYQTGAFLQQIPNPASPPPTTGFALPEGMAVDPQGDIWVSDTDNWRMLEYAPDGTTLLNVFGHRGGGNVGYNYARGIAIDPTDSSLVVADTDNHMIKKYAADGTFEWSVGGFGTTLGKFMNPHGVDVGPDGTIYVADTQGHRVVELTPNGAPIRAFGSTGTGNGQFKFDRGIALDGNGTPNDPSDDTLWVSDSVNCNVQHFTLTGTFLGKFGSCGSADNQLLKASDVEVDANYVYVADIDAHKVKIWSKAGVFVNATSGGGSAPGQMFGPHGMDLTPNGCLYVEEQTGERVQEFAVTNNGVTTCTL